MVFWRGIERKEEKYVERMKMLIADPSEQFVTALADTVRGAYILRTARDGREVMELMDVRSVR